MADRDRSLRLYRARFAAMLFQLAWRATPKDLRDSQLITYGLYAGVPSAIMRSLRR